MCYSAWNLLSFAYTQFSVLLVFPENVLLMWIVVLIFVRYPCVYLACKVEEYYLPIGHFVANMELYDIALGIKLDIKSKDILDCWKGQCRWFTRLYTTYRQSSPYLTWPTLQYTQNSRSTTLIIHQSLLHKFHSSYSFMQ